MSRTFNFAERNPYFQLHKASMEAEKTMEETMEETIEKTVEATMEATVKATVEETVKEAEATPAEQGTQAAAAVADDTKTSAAPAAAQMEEAPVAHPGFGSRRPTQLLNWLSGNGISVIGANTCLRDVPQSVRELALFMAENFEAIKPLLTAMRASYCTTQDKRGRFYYTMQQGDNGGLLLELITRMERTGCFNDYKTSSTAVSGRLSTVSNVHAFVIGRHAELWCHSVTREIVASVAQRLGTDWEVISNAEMILASGERAEADELIRVGDKVFVVEVKTQQKGVDYDRFHHVGDQITGNDPKHLMMLNLNACDAQIEALRYFHQFCAANARSYTAALEAMILDAFGAAEQAAA